MSLVFVQSASDISTVESEFGDAGLVISKKYNRISTDTRDSLLAKIFFENKKIKIAAKELNMNYSTAKTILHLYRKKQKKGSKKIKEENRCHFKSLTPQTAGIFEVVVSQGGKQMTKSMQNVTMKTVTKPICKKSQEDINFYQFQVKMALCQHLKKNIERNAAKQKAQITPNFIFKERAMMMNNDKEINVKKNVIVIKPVIMEEKPIVMATI